MINQLRGLTCWEDYYKQQGEEEKEFKKQQELIKSLLEEGRE